MNPEPNAEYRFDGAIVRIYGTCSNIREETEKFLKQVARKNQAKKPKNAAHKGVLDDAS